ncbi:MAG: biopolymer transporter ExbD [Verrucomicrobiota bacterium]
MSVTQKAHKRKRSGRGGGEPAEVPMTPMIDVVFQLLIYFIVTFEPQDVMAHLDVFTPSPEQKQEQPKKPDIIRIQVLDDGFTMNDKTVSEMQMQNFLSKLAAIDTTQTILIEVSPFSPHISLVKVLDFCSKVDLRSLSVISIK